MCALRIIGGSYKFSTPYFTASVIVWYNIFANSNPPQRDWENAEKIPMLSKFCINDVTIMTKSGNFQSRSTCHSNTCIPDQRWVNPSEFYEMKLNRGTL